ncbi:MAG: NAD-dependent deacylase, partial [Actinomycetota bacterium]|nr:NAD-dependent deacylase [Actinomycetota bacterium]
MTAPATEIPKSLVETLRSAYSVAVLTGSGISAESGVPTFRDAQTGLWARYDPMELATPGAFTRDSRLVWEWYAWRRKLVEGATPNPGHEALAELERRVPEFALMTQNVDGLHRRAGSQRVIELHGNIMLSKCSREGVVVESRTDDPEVPPTCSHCGALLRPDVVWFGEMLPQEAFEEALMAARNCDLFFAIGTSSLVQPAASLPFEALRGGVSVVEVNPDETPLTRHV